MVSRGEIRFENLGFSYTADKPVINDFNLTIQPGERIGLIGRSGAGKSTLVNLLLRFYPITEGCIRIDGQDISQVSQDSLRKNIGMVTQDTSLLHRSVRENLLYGRPDASEEAMQSAARNAEAEEFIRELTDGMGRVGYRCPCRRTWCEVIRWSTTTDSYCKSHAEKRPYTSSR